MWKKAKMTARRGTLQDYERAVWRGARQDKERAVWRDAEKGDHEDRAGQGRFARRPPAAFMPPRAAAVLPP